MKPLSGSKKTNQIKSNFRQEMPKMPYLPACVKRHYVSIYPSNTQIRMYLKEKIENRQLGIAGSTGVVLWSIKPSSLRALTGCWSLRMAFASTCLTRSRVTLKILPTSSNV